MREPRGAGGQEMTYGRSYECYLKRFDLPPDYTDWAPIAQNRGDWRRRVTQPLFTIGKPFVRRSRGDTRRTPEQRREDEARRAAETAERQANFDAASNCLMHTTTPIHELYPTREPAVPTKYPRGGGTTKEG